MLKSCAIYDKTLLDFLTVFLYLHFSYTVNVSSSMLKRELYYSGHDNPINTLNKVPFGWLDCNQSMPDCMKVQVLMPPRCVEDE